MRRLRRRYRLRQPPPELFPGLVGFALFSEWAPDGAALLAERLRAIERRRAFERAQGGDLFEGVSVNAGGA